MGLDVTAYRGIRKLDALFDADGEPVDPVTRKPLDDYFRVYVNMDFPRQAAGLEDRGVYAYTANMSGWSGGYGRYGQWRERLAKLAGYQAVPYERVAGLPSSTVMSHSAGAWAADSGPFHELILFSDCEGAIGADVAAKLARDFAEWDDRAKAAEDEEFYSRYAQWRRVFEFAVDNGAVVFH